MSSAQISSHLRSISAFINKRLAHIFSAPRTFATGEAFCHEILTRLPA